MIPLTQEQEAVAFRLIEKGDEASRALFVQLNQPLVGEIASRYQEKGLTWEELLSAGNVGLLKAVEKFDYKRGFKFSTCAVPWIKGAITAVFKANKAQRKSEFDAPLAVANVEEESDQTIAVANVEEEGDQNIAVLGLDRDVLPALKDAAQRLEDPRQKQIIAMHFGLDGEEPRTLAEIGKCLGISGQRVAAIEKAAIRQLRDMNDPVLELLFEGMFQ